MKRILLLSFFCFTLNALSAQGFNPVNWSFSVTTDEEGNQQFHAEATLDKGWYIYSMSLDDSGPIPTRLDFAVDPGIELSGDPTEKGKKYEGYDAMFGMNVIKFGERVTFSQTIIPGKAEMITGSIEYMTCDDEKCLPPRQVPFQVKL